MSARRELTLWEPHNQWFLVGFRADVIQCEVTDLLLFSEMNRFATDDHGALMSYLEGPTLFMAKGEVGGGGEGIFKIRVGWACVSNIVH